MPEVPPSPPQGSSPDAKRQHLLDVIEKAAEGNMPPDHVIGVSVLACLVGIWDALDDIADTLRAFAAPQEVPGEVILDEGGKLHTVRYRSVEGSEETVHIRATGQHNIIKWVRARDGRILEIKEDE